MTTRKRKEVARIQRKPRFVHESIIKIQSLMVSSWMKKKHSPRQLSEPRKRQSVSLQRLPQRLKKKRQKLPLRKQMRRVILMMIGRKQQPNPSMKSKIVGMPIQKRKEKRLRPKRLPQQMAKQNRQAYPRGTRNSRSQTLSRSQMNHQKMRKYLRLSKRQP
jgi:hypothetical protein